MAPISIKPLPTRDPLSCLTSTKHHHHHHTLCKRVKQVHVDRDHYAVTCAPSHNRRFGLQLPPTLALWLRCFPELFIKGTPLSPLRTSQICHRVTCHFAIEHGKAYLQVKVQINSSGNSTHRSRSARQNFLWPTVQACISARQHVDV